MDRFHPSTLPKPAVESLAFDTSHTLPAGPHAPAAHDGMLSKLIRQQGRGAENPHERDFRRQLRRALSDLKDRSDRVLEENRRMAQALADLQQGQAHLVEQLALHQQREELAVMRERQDGKRIRELENRLSLLLLAPLQDQPITIAAPAAQRFAICQTKQSEPAAEEPDDRASTVAAEASDPSPAADRDDVGRAVSQAFPAGENPGVDSPPDGLAHQASSIDEWDALGEVPPLDLQPADEARTHAGRERPQQPPILEASLEEVAAEPDAESDIIDLLHEIDAADRAQDPLAAELQDAADTAPDGPDGEESVVNETTESSSLNTHYVLEAPRGAMLATETADPPTDEMPVETDSIITLLDEIHCDRASHGPVPATDLEKCEWPEPVDVSTPPLVEEPVVGEGGGPAGDRVAAGAVEDCLENLEDADTNALEVIDLTKEAVGGQAPGPAARPGSEPPAGPAPMLAQEAARKESWDPGGPSPETKGKSARAKVLFGRGKLACQRKDYVKAIDFFNRFLDLVPDDPRGCYNLAILHYRMKEYRRAAAHARKALDLGYSNAEPIMAKITLKSASVAAAEAAGKKSASDALLETETVHHMSLPAAAEAQEDRQTTARGTDAASAGTGGGLLRHTVLEDDLLDLSPGGPASGAALDPLLNDETALMEPAGARQAPTPLPPVAGNRDAGAAARRFFVDGMRAYRKKDYRAGLAHFSRFAAVRPQEAKGHYNLAIIHYRLKDYPKALECARRAQELGAGAARDIVKKIETKTASRGAVGAHAPSGPAARTPGDPSRLSAADNRAGTGMADTASIWGADELEEEINQVLISAAADDPPNGRGEKEDEILFETTFGGEKESAGKPAEGQVTATMTAEEPEGVFQNERLKNIFDLGRAAVENKDYLKAIQHFSKVTRLAPNDHRGYYHLADVSFRLRFYETAREHATRASELGSAAARNILGQITARQLPA